MDKYCSNCGNPINGNFCSNCGKPVNINLESNAEYVGTSYVEPEYSKNTFVKEFNPVVRKKNGCLRYFLMAFLFFIITFVFGIVYANQNKDDLTQTNVSTTKNEKSTLLEFDEKSWEDFKLLYTSHNSFMENVSAYSEGKVNSLDFYNACSEAKKYFQKASTSFNYGSNDDEVTYLNVFVSAALSDQQAAEYLIKYIDSGKTSHLSKAQENIQDAKDAFILIASNRGKLLVKAGLTDEEIKEKVESDMAELETE